MVKFGELVRYHRQQRGLLLRMLAKQLGISEPYLSHLETGVRPPNAPLIEKLIKVFDLCETEIARLRQAAVESGATSAGVILIDLKGVESDDDRRMLWRMALTFKALSDKTKRRIKFMLEAEASNLAQNRKGLGGRRACKPPERGPSAR